MAVITSSVRVAAFQHTAAVSNIELIRVGADARDLADLGVGGLQWGERDRVGMDGAAQEVAASSRGEPRVGTPG